MKPFDVIVKINTFIVGLLTLGVLISFPSNFLSLDTQSGGNDRNQEKGSVAGAFVEAANAEDAQRNTQPTPSPLPSPTPTPTPIPVADPVGIDIPSIGVSASVVQVGVTEDNVMEIPEDFAQVGWFNQSLKPGEHGDFAAIMSGHFDRTNGYPAVFYSLEQLQDRAEIIVTAADGKKYVFEKIDDFSHPLEGFPTDIVYGNVSSTSLKLITCDGVWHANARSYSDRIVVTAVLKEIIDNSL